MDDLWNSFSNSEKNHSEDFNNVVTGQSLYCCILIIITTQRRRKTSEDFFRKICISHFIVRVRKGLLRVLLWEGVGDRIELQYIDPHSYGRQHCLSRSPGLLNRRPRGPALCWMMAFFTASYHQLVSKTPSGVPRAPSAGCGFPYHILSPTSLKPNCLASCLDRVI